METLANFGCAGDDAGGLPRLRCRGHRDRLERPGAHHVAAAEIRCLENELCTRALQNSQQFAQNFMGVREVAPELQRAGHGGHRRRRAPREDEGRRGRAAAQDRLSPMFVFSPRAPRGCAGISLWASSTSVQSDDGANFYFVAQPKVAKQLIFDQLLKRSPGLLIHASQKIKTELFRYYCRDFF